MATTHILWWLWTRWNHSLVFIDLFHSTSQCLRSWVKSWLPFKRGCAILILNWKLIWNELSFLIKSKIKSRIDDSPSIFFFLHPHLIILMQRKNETLQRLHNYIPIACSDSLQLLEKLGLLFIILRSFIDLFGKSVLSKQIWGTKLEYTFLTFIHLFFISCI